MPISPADHDPMTMNGARSMTRPDPAVELENAAQLVAKAACNCGTCKPYFVESVRNVADLLGFDLVRRTPQSDVRQDVAESAEPAMLLQISGDLPWCVAGWRTYEDTDVAPDLIAIYGPVPTKEDADRLAITLADLTPGAGETALFTVVRAHPVRPTPQDTDPAVVA